MASGSAPVKLSLANLLKIEHGVRIPTFIRNPPSGRTIVHISVGGFHRSHQAVYLDDLLQCGKGEDWRLVGVGLLPFDLPARDAMQAQDCLYTLLERDASGDSARVIASIGQYLYAPEESDRVIDVMADGSCRIVSLTITEGGYFVHQGTGKFNSGHPDIEHDLNHPDAPRSSFGFLLAALKRRRTKNIPPFTILSCDNLQHNGDVAKEMIVAFAEKVDVHLAEWLRKEGSFPNCMVDRITPATTNEHRKLVLEKFGIIDQWPVTAESFRQWVIEDKFPLTRPAWDSVGALMTTDVEPYELMKLRLLNASHQALCYIGMLIGLRYAPEAMANKDITKLLRRLMDEEVTQLVPTVPGVNIEAYKATLLQRFANPAVNDQLTRIGTEGSARIPKFVLPSVRDSIKRTSQNKFLCFTVASWLFYLAQETDEIGNTLEFSDPMLERIKPQAVKGGRNPLPLLSVTEVFGADLVNNEQFVNEVRFILDDFYTHGAKTTLTKWINS